MQAMIPALAATAVSASTAFTALHGAERTDLEHRLTKWKTLYGPVAQAIGFAPASLSLTSHTDMELLRFHETTVAVREAAAANPLATFTQFNQSALLSAQKFKQVLVKSFGNETFDAAPLPLSGFHGFNTDNHHDIVFLSHCIICEYIDFCRLHDEPHD
ncbi:hypothetical protein DYB32_008538 [Aphanomyces invadans]|uniref:Uncharacterized protein n=1 Tax=Aphanomyces invadans TaxID=157072 RepID=A0A3R6V5J8_9STRA|nr:hypothetical protein DYB32_008538 [Aphanomyces invadans]